MRYYGAYANRVRARYRPGRSAPAEPASQDTAPYPEDAESEFVRAERRSWTRLLRKIFEIDPLLRPRCGVEMEIVSVLTEPKVVDQILAHLAAGKGHHPLDARAPPAA